VSALLNPFSTLPKASSVFTVYTFTPEGYTIDMGTVSAPSSVFALSPNNLTSKLLAPVSPIMVGRVDTYTFSVSNPTNPIPMTNGSLVIALSSDVVI
jgi:hypothetical protein